ncbi:MAG: HPr family phosphocarrier protein [Planctomycetes bacterium]|nr:HPr family phosphocarrier protein [Planctomycetota bacterium]
MPIVTRAFTVNNPVGLHVRPMQLVAEVVARHASRVTLQVGSRVADARSPIELVTLAAVHGTVVTARAEGDDAEQVMADLAALFDARFGERSDY